MEFLEKKRLFDWLDHEQYDKHAESLDLNGWGHAFFCRATWDVEKQIRCGKREEAIEFLSSLAALYHQRSGSFHPFVRDNGYCPVGSVSADLAVAYARSLQAIPDAKKSGTASFELYDSLTIPEQDLNDPAHSFDGDIHQESAGAVAVLGVAVIDILAPDDAIIAGLKEWLAKQRKDLDVLAGIKSRYTEADMRRWRDLRLLQYLDLSLFANLSEISLTQHETGLIIFPDSYDINLADKIRRVVRPEAEKMASTVVAARLSAQAAFEARQSGTA